MNHPELQLKPINYGFLTELIDTYLDMYQDTELLALEQELVKKPHYEIASEDHLMTVSRIIDRLEMAESSGILVTYI